MQLIMIGILILWIGWNIVLTASFIRCGNEKYNIEMRNKWKNVDVWWFKIRGRTIGDIFFRYIISMWFTIIVMFIKIMKIKVSI